MADIAYRPASRPRGNGLIVIAAVLLGLLTAALVVTYVRQKADEQETRSEASVPVVVAKQDIPLGATITSGMLEQRLVTPDVAIASAFSDTGKVVEKRARYPITAGAQVVPGMVVEGVDRDALSYVVPPGKRAVAITGSDVIGGGGHIRPGDFVDVMVTIEAWRLTGGTPPASSNDRPKGVYTILQSVEVLAVADEAEKITAAGPDAKEEKKSPNEKESKNKSVTLAVDPAQAQLLFLAESEGKVRLSLRPFGDRDQQSVPAVIEPLNIPIAPPVARN